MDTVEQTNKPKRVNVRIDVAAMAPGERVGLRRHVMEHKVRYDREAKLGAKGGAASPGAFAPMTDAEYMEKFGHVEHLALYFSTTLDRAAAGTMVVGWVQGWAGAGGYRALLDEGVGTVRVEPVSSQP